MINKANYSIISSEVEILTQVSNHPHIIQLISQEEIDNYIWIIYEYCNEGNLD